MMETKRIITPQEFITIFETRFNGFPIYISYNNAYISAGTAFEKTEVYLYNNMIQFYEEDGEVPYRFEINFDNIEKIEMEDSWLNTKFKELDKGGTFEFFGNDGFSITISAEK